MSIRTLTPEHLRSHPLPDHEDGSGKDGRGRVLLVAGSASVPGAALLAGLGALRAGAGVLQIASCRSVATHLAIAMPEALVRGFNETQEGSLSPDAHEGLVDLAESADAVLIGPGMFESDATTRLARDLIEHLAETPIVLDAAAFTAFASSPTVLRGHRGPLVVTPHAGEMARFLGEERSTIEHDPLAAAQRVNDLTGAVVIMKGAKTFIVGNGQSWSSEHGSAALATSGSGDTLAGVLIGLLARGTDALLSVLWSVYLHAEAGRRLAARHGRVGLLARELPDEVPGIMEGLHAKT
jgi:hydroxyethylthiazole kinase-like uncharacterized protein yjeF